MNWTICGNDNIRQGLNKRWPLSNEKVYTDGTLNEKVDVYTNGTLNGKAFLWGIV